MTKQKKKEKKVKKAKLKKLAIKEAKLKSKVKSKKPKKDKKQSKILDRKYTRGEVHFPIYVFNSKLVRVLKLKDRKHVTDLGKHLGTLLTCVRDETSCNSFFYSYNKSFK